MKIADLFVHIGVEGGNIAVKSLTAVSNGLAEISSMALKSTAAVFGLIYGLEKLTDPSNKFGTALVNFGNRTGIDTENIQRWMYAARKAGAANEDVTASFEAMQDKLTAMQQGRGEVPAGMSVLAPFIEKNHTNINDMEGIAKDYVELVDEMKKAGKSVASIKFVGDSLGLTKGFQDAAIKGVLTDKNFKEAHIIKKKGLETLDKLRNDWQEISNNFFLEIAKLNIKHMPKLMPQIKEFIHSFLDFVDALSVFSEKYNLVEHAGDVLNGFTLLFKTLSGKTLTDKDINNSLYGKIKAYEQQQVKAGNWQEGNNIVSQRPDQTITVNAPITQTFHGPTDHAKVGQATKNATKDLMPAWLNPVMLQGP